MSRVTQLLGAPSAIIIVEESKAEVSAAQLSDMRRRTRKRARL